MPPRQRRHADTYDSDSSFAPSDDDVDDDVFDVDGDDDGSDTDATDFDDFGADAMYDVEDQIQLFGGNLHPPEYWQKAVEEFNEDEFDGPDYSKGTLKLMDYIEEAWRLYCCKELKRDPQDCYENIAILYNFFKWLLCQKVDKRDRKKREIKTKSTLGTSWKVFRLVYERRMGDKLDFKLGRRMRKVFNKLAEEYNLSDQARVNRPMTTNQLKELNETTLSTTRQMFKLGEVRILVVLFRLLLAPAGARPTAILRLRYKDIRVVLARDPDGGPHKLLLRFTPKFTKTYLGAKAKTTYPIPETLYDPSLLLSPHVFLLGILFRHRAFKASSLISPHQLDSLDIHPGELELPLPLHEDLDDVFIFRRAVETLTGFEISPNKPISYAMIRGWFKKTGELLGLEHDLIFYSLRYNTANEMDQSADVSENLRNLVMGHASSEPFQKHYLQREVPVDLWAIQRGQKPQQALLKQSGSVGHSISKRRPVDLTPKQAASVVTHPAVRKVTRKLQKLPICSREYKEGKKNLQNLKLRLKRNLKQKIRAEWTDKQATEDIERQLKGIGFMPVEVDNSYPPQGTAQKRLMEAFTAPVATTLEGNYRRRNNAILATSAYCLVQEGCTKRRSHLPKATATPDATPDLQEDSPLYHAMLSVYVSNKKERPRRCFVCLGQAQSLQLDDPRMADLIHEFYTPNDLTKHFRRKHLSKVKDGDKTECKVCDISLAHKMHFQRHAIEVHGTVS